MVAWCGYPLTYVRNITDIDDKIIARAAESGETIGELTARFIQAMHEDADALGVLRPDIEPKATENIPQMIAMIETPDSNGGIFCLKRRRLLRRARVFGLRTIIGQIVWTTWRAGERVEVDGFKRDPRLIFGVVESRQSRRAGMEKPVG